MLLKINWFVSASRSEKEGPQEMKVYPDMLMNTKDLISEILAYQEMSLKTQEMVAISGNVEENT